jgi:hypothetical protein
MRKLKLDALAVESFETSVETRAELGTVQGQMVSASPTSCCPKETFVYACPVSTSCPRYDG